MCFGYLRVNYIGLSFFEDTVRHSIAVNFGMFALFIEKRTLHFLLLLGAYTCEPVHSCLFNFSNFREAFRESSQTCTNTPLDDSPRVHVNPLHHGRPDLEYWHWC